MLIRCKECREISFCDHIEYNSNNSNNIITNIKDSIV